MKTNVSPFPFMMLLLCSLFLFSITPFSAMAQEPPPEARSLFVNGNLDATFSFPLVTYAIINDSVYWVDQAFETTHDLGPMGLAVDETSERLFITYEGADVIEVVNARDSTPLGSFVISGPSDLCGIRVHQGRGHLYVADRRTSDIYVYDTTTLTQVDHWTLPDEEVAWGIDLMEEENWLFATDLSTNVNYYDIDTHTKAGSVTLTYPATAIAVASYPEKIIFTQGHDGAVGMQPYATKYEMDSGVETFVMTGTNPKGVSLDPGAGLAFAVADNKVQVVDLDTMTLLSTENLNWTWNPTDCLATTIQFPCIVDKRCSSHPEGNIRRGDTVVFEIAIRNLHDRPIHLLPVTDTYDTGHLSFVSADPPVDDPADDGELDWSDLIAQEGADLPSGHHVDIEVTFIANEDCNGQVSGVNTAAMHDAEDDQGAAVTDSTGDFQYSLDCSCDENADCDDGRFCNGLETCRADNTCESPGNPCPHDDGLFCNGEETEACDEEFDECGHAGDPCEEDETCNEEADTCDPLGDDDDNDTVDDDATDDDVVDDDDSKATTGDDDDDSSGCGG